MAQEVPNLLERFSKEFQAVEAVTVIRDRRVGERRRTANTNGAERRRTDRRQRGWADSRLRTEGWALSDALTETEHPRAVTITLPAADPRKITDLLDAIQMLSRELNLTRLLQLIMDKASRLLSADRSSLFVVDEDKQELWSKIAQGLEVREIRIPIGHGIAGGVAATGVAVNIPDAYADPRFNQDVDRRTGYRTRAILCAPVRDRADRVVAVLQLLNRLDGAPFDAEDERLLDAFVGQVAIALRNAQQMEQIEQRRRTSELLLDVMKSFSSELEVDTLLKTIMERTSAVLQADRSTLFLVDRKTREICPRSPRARTWSRSGCRSARHRGRRGDHRRDDQHPRRLRRSALQPGGGPAHRLPHAHDPLRAGARRPGHDRRRRPGPQQGRRAVPSPATT